MNKTSINKIKMYNILSTILLQGVALFTSPIFSRMLGTTNYGIVAIYNTWISVISIVFGLQTQSTIAVARNEYGEDEQEKYQSSILSLSFVVYILFSIVMLILIEPMSKLMQMQKLMFILMLMHGFGQFSVTFINIKFTYEFKADKNFILSCATTFISVILSLVLIFILPSSKNYWGRIIGISFTYIIIGTISAIFIFIKGKVFFNKEYWRFCIPLALPIVFHNLSGLILSQSDRVMLQYSSSFSYVGIYSLAYSFGSIISTIWNALNNSWVPFYYEFTNYNKNAELKEHTKNYTELFTVLSIGFILLSPEVYHVFAGKEYWGGTELITIFAMGFYMIFLYSFHVNYEFYNRKTVTIAIGTMGAAIINIILNYILIKQYGILGAAISTFISYFIQYIFHVICTKIIEKKVEKKYVISWKILLPYVIVFYICAVVCLYCQNNFTIVRWLVAILLGIFEILQIKKRKAIF